MGTLCIWGADITLAFCTSCGSRFSFGDGENVLELDSGDGCNGKFYVKCILKTISKNKQTNKNKAKRVL